jgi:ATP-dependent helicase HepA
VQYEIKNQLFNKLSGHTHKMKQPFVISTENKLGIGKLIQKNGDIALIEYFRSPAEKNPLRQEVPFETLKSKILVAQTRVYFENQEDFTWKIGRILEYHQDNNNYFVRFPNDESYLIHSDNLKTRCNLPIDDPTDHLAHQLNETAFWHSLRSDFVRHLLEQRKSYLNLTALVSSSIELVPHQMSVVQKVLLDPFQRYLLADEVGLGKTIEAGILIKQFSLEQALIHEAIILIIVPESLLTQWQQELTHRFHLGAQIGHSIQIISNFDKCKIHRFASTAKMIVIDEAHHISSWAWSSESNEYETFCTIREAVSDLQKKVLLLSATPVLHNEKSFLAMLHLLDPQVYLLDSIDTFKKRVQIRQEIAECMLSLSETESNYFIADALKILEKLLESDSEFQQLRIKLEVLINQGIDEDHPDRNDLIRSIRTHVSDMWQLHRRIIRNRRTEKTSVYLPGRGGAKVIEYDCDAERSLCETLDSWRLTLSLSCLSADSNQKQQVCELVKIAEELAATEPRELIIWAKTRLNASDLHEGEDNYLNQIIRAANECNHSVKLHHLQLLIQSDKNDVSYVIFTNSKITADIVFDFLEPKFANGRVLRHSINSHNWRSFRFSKVRSVLVCDREGEEGLNLQRRGTIAIHFDLPFSSNRLDQRMGRLDRFGHGMRVQTVVFLSLSSRVQRSWFELINKVLKVFDRSVTTLQYVIEDELVQIWSDFLDSGDDAFKNASERLSGENGKVTAELKRICAQDELDTFEPDQISKEIAEKIESNDFEFSRKSYEIFSKWLQDGLKFQRTGESFYNDKVFSYRFCRRIDTRSFNGNQDTLMPLDEFQNRFIHSIDNLPCELPTRHITFPMTFDRVVAQKSSSRLLRVGDPLVDSFDEYTRWDDRGVCFAFWRYCPNYQPIEDPDVFFKINYVLSSDLKPIDELCSREPKANLSSLMRRNMVIMKPAFITFWLDANLKNVTLNDFQFGNLLDTPFAKTSQSWGRDYNLNSSRWNLVAKQYSMVDWQELCFAARRESEDLLRKNSKFSEFCNGCVKVAKDSASRIDQQFRSRMAMASGELLESLRKEQEFEKAFLEAQIKCFSKPTLRVDSIGAIFLSPKNPFFNENKQRNRRDEE